MSDPDGVTDATEPVTPAAEGLSGRQIQRLAMSGSMWTALHAITSVPVAFVANAVIARSLGVVDYGSLAFLTVAFAVTMQVANAGFSDSVLQAGSAAHARGHGSLVDALLRRSSGFHLVVELPILWAVGLYLTRDAPFVVAGALLVANTVVCAFGTATLALSIENRSAVGAKLVMITNLGVQVATAVVAVTTMSPIAVVVTRIVMGSLVVPVNLIALGRRRREVLLPRLPRGMPAGFWRFAAQSFAAGLLGLLVFSRSEIVLLSWLSTPEAVGVFALAFGLSYQLTAPVDAMLGPLTPAISGLVSAHPDLARRAFLRSLRFAAVLASLITAALLPLIYFAVPVVYGAEFGPAAVLLLPLALASCIQSMAAPVTAFIVARRHGGRLIRANASALVVNVVVSVVLIASVGVWGAVIGNICGQLASVVALSRGELAVQRVSLAECVLTMRLWIISIPTAGVAVGIGLLATSAGLPALLAGIVAAAVGGLAIVGGARFGRAGLDSDDREAVLDALPNAARRLAGMMTSAVTSPARASFDGPSDPGDVP